MPEREHFDRVVAIGDLNGACSVLRDILQGTGVTDARDQWIAGKTHLIQVGDVFNRGPAAREAFALLRSLGDKARSKGGKVTALLGNHEVMTALRNEAYCTVEEYLSFATETQRAAWPARVARAQKRLYRDHRPGGPILPLSPRVEEWMIHHVPGRTALRRAMGPRGEIGEALRSLPIATVAAGCVFCHAALTPRWARLGIEGLERAVRDAWQKAPRFFEDLDARDLLRAARGPLWNRQITLHENAATRGQIERSLARLGVERMVVGHTQTDHIPGGQPGRISLRHDGKLVCIDVGLGRRTPSPRTALIIEDGAGIEWMPGETRQLWGTGKGWRSSRARHRSRA
jgi:hypothetical protein